LHIIKYSNSIIINIGRIEANIDDFKFSSLEPPNIDFILSTSPISLSSIFTPSSVFDSSILFSFEETSSGIDISLKSLDSS